MDWVASTPRPRRGSSVRGGYLRGLGRIGAASPRHPSLMSTQVALETKRKLRDEPTPPVPGESRRGLGVACEPSTPAARAAKIAANRRAIVAASQHSDPEALATFAAALSLDAVREPALVSK